jgi:hypothetical protein
MKIQDTFQEVSAKLEWRARQAQIIATVRQIEFSLNTLESSIDGLMEALQTVISEKIPVRLISPGTLLGITKNISLTLPEGYRLVAGTSPSSMSWYYEYVKATMVANEQGFLLILSFPLADANRKFELFKIHTFPFRLYNSTFVQYQVSQTYLAVNLLQHTYFTMSDGERRQCQGFNLEVCPVSRPVYSTQVENCALSLYLQRQNVRALCSRSLLSQQPPPVLLRSGKTLLYHFTVPQRVVIQCPHQRDRHQTSWVLQDAGAIYNAASCHVTTEGVQLYPLLDGETAFEGRTPTLFAPDLPEIVSHDELQTLRKLNEEVLHGLKGTDILARSRETDFQTLLDIHSARPHTNNWHIPLLLSVSVILVVIILYFPFHARIIKLCTYRAVPLNPDPSTPVVVLPPQAAPRVELTATPVAVADQVNFVKYPPQG